VGSTEAGASSTTDGHCTADDRRSSLGAGSGTSPIVMLARSGDQSRLAEQLGFLRKLDWGAALSHGLHMACDLDDLEALCQEFEEARAAAKAV
jgi:hypothetical protein